MFFFFGFSRYCLIFNKFNFPAAQLRRFKWRTFSLHFLGNDLGKTNLISWIYESHDLFAKVTIYIIHIAVIVNFHEILYNLGIFTNCSLH